VTGRLHWTSVAFGSLSLALADAVLTHKQSGGRLGGFLSSMGAAAQRFLSPTVPFFGTGQAGVKVNTSPAAKTTPKTTTPTTTTTTSATTTSAGPTERTPHPFR
jgi:hypothetical protein